MVKFVVFEGQMARQRAGLRRPTTLGAGKAKNLPYQTATKNIQRKHAEAEKKRKKLEEEEQKKAGKETRNEEEVKHERTKNEEMLRKDEETALNEKKGRTKTTEEEFKEIEKRAKTNVSAIVTQDTGIQKNGGNGEKEHEENVSEGESEEEEGVTHSRSERTNEETSSASPTKTPKKRKRGGRGGRGGKKKQTTVENVIQKAPTQSITPPITRLKKKQVNIQLQQQVKRMWQNPREKTKVFLRMHQVCWI